MSTNGHRTKWHRNIAKNFNRLNMVHERYRQTDDRQATNGRTMTYSERQLFLGKKSAAVTGLLGIF